MYYVTMLHDNVEEVIGVYKEDTTTIKQFLVNVYGELNTTVNDNGTIECVPWNDNETVFRIVNYNG